MAIARRILLALLVSAAAALPAGAQTIRGTLVDETTNAPIPGATILLLDPAGRRQGETLTDQAGAWSVEAPSPGATYAVRARKAGFASVDTRPFRARPDAPSLDLVTRPEIAVLAGVSAPALNYAGLLERKEAKLGRILGPEEVQRRIERVGATEPSRVLWGLLPGLQRLEDEKTVVFPRRGMHPQCVATLVVDGKRYDPTFPDGGERAPPWDIDDLVSISEVRAVEVYQDPTFVPAAMKGQWLDPIIQRCGVVVVWTYRGLGVE